MSGSDCLWVCTPQRFAGPLACLSAVISLFLSSPARAQYVLEDEQNKTRYGPNTLILPYAFYTPSDRFGGGFIWDVSGFAQPQTDSFGLAFGNINNTYGIEGGENDIQIPRIDRLFVDSEFGFFRYNYDKIYIDGSRKFPDQSAGTNDSSDENFFKRRHTDDWGHFTLKYVLPIGGGRDVIINHFVLEDGLLKDGSTGGKGWNPFISGRTYLQLTPFYEYQLIERRTKDERFDENGLRFGVVYDNTDFILNPSSGNISRFTLSRDFGLFDSSNAWTNAQGEFSQYLDLGKSKLFRQQVLAMDVWTSYSITWNETMQGGRRVLSNSPPFYEGSVLGGDTRFRGYADNRFWDRAAVYGSLELRLVPQWNPFKRFPILKKADITWLQWVIFAETGRVAPEYTQDLLHHLKADAGFGVRMLANDTLIRFDIAASNEGYGVWARLNQAF